MQPFEYARPTSLAEAVRLLAERGPEARLLAGGTDLIIRLRDGSARPEVVVDVKGIAELRRPIEVAGGVVRIPATASMTQIAAHPTIVRSFRALVEAASVVGSVQIRNRATLAGNLCNASPAADTAPCLLVYDAVVVAFGPDGERRISVDDFFVRSGVTTLAPAELVTAIELPVPPRHVGATHVRRTRRRGHDLASITLACAVDVEGVTRLAFGSVGPRPVLRVDRTGTLADPGASDEARDRLLDLLFADARPSPTSMRAAPDYRLAMLRVLGRRALATAIGRLSEDAAA